MNHQGGLELRASVKNVTNTVMIDGQGKVNVFLGMAQYDGKLAKEEELIVIFIEVEKVPSGACR